MEGGSVLSKGIKWLHTEVVYQLRNHLNKYFLSVTTTSCHGNFILSLLPAIHSTIVLIPARTCSYLPCIYITLTNLILGSSIEPLATDLLHSGRHQCVKIQLWCIFSAPLPDYVLNVIGLSPNPLTHFPSPLPYSLISADCLIHEPVGRSHSTATYRVLN